MQTRARTNVKIVAGPVPLAPLVDVVFLLLIFFMISSSLVFWPGLRVETRAQLPPSRTKSMTAADKLVITMTRADLLFFNDTPVSWDALELRLKEAVLSSDPIGEKQNATSPTQKKQARRLPLVVLRADTNIPYGKIVEIISLARSLDLGVYLVTDPEENGRY